MKTTTIKIPSSLYLALLALGGCAPVFSEMQGARTAGKDHVEVLPSFSTVYYNEAADPYSDAAKYHTNTNNDVGIQTSIGLSESIDFRFRYEYIWNPDDFSEGVHVVGVGPKIGLLKDRIALGLPVGRAFAEGDYNASWEAQPTMLFTIPLVKDKIDFNFSGKYLITFCEDCGNFMAFNVGFAIGDDVTKLSFRPEFGLLYSPGDPGHFSHFSIGICKNFGQ